MQIGTFFSDIDQLAKQHFDNMIRAKLVTLEPTAEAMLPDAPVVTTSPNKTPKKKPMMGSPKSEAATSSSSSSGNPTIYSCDQCDKTFTKKSSITRHKYEHSGKDLLTSFYISFSPFLLKYFVNTITIQGGISAFRLLFFVKSYKTMLKATFK